MPDTPAHWRLETDADRVAWLTIDVQGAGANTLGSEVMRQLNDRLAEVEAALPPPVPATPNLRPGRPASDRSTSSASRAPGVGALA